ncbi:hypothetical protein CKM354_000861900 [Cercospora kikuchii]|uniref:F-box domain-containing protein n=1 Tax=Cercospora kikuchii TaxID=84275 RepID=A0A9P3FFF5_9PEZI|nr:uncharacterized protein CKM354_000861900 [Cercospora kikuchii]GIZ45453.1 hypothetical protein CKM354_000861900 [Cercospora kikuchii]
MFNRFRRSSKTARSSPSDDDPRKPSIATQSNKPQRKPTTFFDLPAELRNLIYEHTASETHLRLLAKNSEQSKYKRKNIPGLLLTSRQSRSEFLPILLSTAYISITIQNFNFSNLIRITGSLYNTELKSLRLNPNLTIFLTFPNPNSSVLPVRDQALESSLRTWITYRAAGMDKLPWHYAIPIRGRMPRESGHVRFMMEYKKCVGVVEGLRGKVSEVLQWELGIMRGELEELEGSSVEFWRERYEVYDGSEGEKRRGAVGLGAL